MTIHGVTFEWTEPHASGGRSAVYLDDEIKMTLIHMEWERILAANLATASLLCRSADIAYSKGIADGYDAGQRDQRWTGIVLTSHGYPDGDE